MSSLLRLLASLPRPVPPLADRTPITPLTFPLLLLPFPLLLLLALLARRPRTHTLRLALLPPTLLLSAHAGYAYVFPDPAHAPYNFACGLWGYMCFFKALELALNPVGCLKVGERVPGEGVPADRVPLPASTDGSTSPAHPPEKGSIAPPSRPLPSHPARLALYDALDLLCSLRGIGWTHGAGMYIPPPPYPPSDRRGWLLASARTFILNFLLLDFLESILKLHPNLAHPGGGSIYLPSLSRAQNLLLGTGMSFLTGLAIYAGFQMVYHLLALLSVLLLSHSPALWPPIMDRPWRSSSLHSFWARRWHQLLRQTFIVSGGLPCRVLCAWAGFSRRVQMGAAMGGTFLASGMYHAASMYAMGGTDASSIVYFCAQAVGVLLERVFRAVTGRRIGGWMGAVWAWWWVVGLGQVACDGWHRFGLGGGLVIPPVLSPTRVVLFPVLRRVVEWAFP